MKFRYKILELKRQQKIYMAYMEDPGKEPLTMDQKLKLCGEITRLQMNIDRIAAMTYTDVERESLDYPIEVPSRFIRPRQRIHTPIPETFSTWSPIR